MAMQYLGETLDMHGGGEDLIFPHHENEIAQSEARDRQALRALLDAQRASSTSAAEKMSKSLGNTLTIRSWCKRHDPEALRLYLLGTHYRHPLDFAEERIAEAARGLARLRALEGRRRSASPAAGTPAPGPDGGLFDEVAAHRARFEAAMDDDFNTPQALGVLFDLARVLHGAREQVAQGTVGAGAFLLGVGELVVLARVLGLLEGVRKEAAVDPQLKARIESLVYLRQEARRQRDFAEADRLRDELGRLGVTIEDTRDGTTWKLHVVTRDMPPRQSPPDESPPLFGRNPVLELLRSGSRRVEEIAIISEGRGPALHELLGLAKRQGVKISYRTRDQLTAMAGDVHHQGVVARVAGASYAALGDLLEIPARARGAGVLPGPGPGAGSPEPRGGAPHRRGHRRPRGDRAQAPRRGLDRERRRSPPWEPRS